jgi:hypothetical protein
MLSQHQQYIILNRRSNLLPTINTPPENYNISMYNQDPVDCPVPTYSANYATRYTMRQHFNYHHWQDTIIIQEEGLLPQCPNCLLFSSTAHQPRHTNCKTCSDGTLRQQGRVQQQRSKQAELNDIHINDQQIQKVTSFKYLGQSLLLELTK